MKVIIICGFILVSLVIPATAQTITNPNYSLKSHETLLIREIELKSDATVFHMSIENRITGGTFCADRNIYILYPDGKKGKLISSSGIPACPETYKFRSPGEKLEFVLTFPPLRPGTGWIDLIEDCNDNCFSFFGIALDNSINTRIDEAFSLAEKKESKEALKSFIRIIEDIDDQNNGIEGLLYINIIKLSILTGDDKGAESWYKRFRVSDSPRLSSYLKYLNEQGIRY